MAKDTIRLVFDQQDYRGLIYAMNRMDKGAANDLRRDVLGISRWTAQGLIQASYDAPMPAQAAVVARTIRSVWDRFPSISIGGPKGQTSGGAQAGNLVIGNEFGGPTRFPNGGRRFPYRSPKLGRGNRGYWIFPTLRLMQPEIRRRWVDTVERHVFKEWSRG